MKIKYVNIFQSWITKDMDDSINICTRTIRHKESYAEWDDEKKDWNYVNVPCNCKLCQEKKQLKLL